MVLLGGARTDGDGQRQQVSRGGFRTRREAEARWCLFITTWLRSASWRSRPATQSWARGLAVRLVELKRVAQERRRGIDGLRRNGEAAIVRELACDGVGQSSSPE